MHKRLRTPVVRHVHMLMWKKSYVGSPVAATLLINQLRVFEPGVTADDDRGCYDPVWPRLTPFDPVLVFFRNNLISNSKLQVSKFPYSK